MNEQAGNTETLSKARVERLLRGFGKRFKPYRRELTLRFGAAAAERIETLAIREYGDILPLTPRFAGRFNLFNWVIGLNATIVALRRAMRAEGHSAEATARVLFSVADAEHRSIPGLLRWLARKLFFSRLFLWFAQRSADGVRHHPEGWKIDYRRASGGDDWYFECTDCGVVKYMHKHDVGELAPYCNYVDYIQSRALGLGLRQSGCIGSGDSCCREDFSQGRETLTPANLVSIVDPGHVGQASRTWTRKGDEP